MTKSLHAFFRTAVTVLALVHPGLVSAQVWSPPKTVANGGSVIAVSTNGAGVAAVMYGTLSAVVETGGTWGAPVVLSNLGPYGNGSGNLTVAPNGDVLAVWSYRTSNTYTPNLAQAAFFTGGHWGKAITISSNVYGNVSSFGIPSIGFDGASQATLVWEEITNSSPMTCALKAITGMAASGFGPAQTISNSTTCFGWSRIAVNRFGAAEVVEGVPGILSGAVLAIGREASGTWDAPVTVGASGVYRQRLPQVGLGNDGTAVSVWLINGNVRYAVKSNGVWSTAAALPGVAGTAGGAAGVAVDGSGNAVATFQQVSIAPGTYATYRPVGGSWQTKVPLSSGVQIVATPAGTFVAGGTTVSTRLAGTSTWSTTTFANSAIVNAAPGQAIAALAPQVSVSTETVP
jgi:hypothetical protein